MINAGKELARTMGHKVAAVTGTEESSEVKGIISGRAVKLNEDGKLVYASSTDTEILGFSADDTEMYKPTTMGTGDAAFVAYDTIDGFYKHGTVATYILGGIFNVWNDGRGPVFVASEVATMKPGAKLYIGTDGVLTTTEGSLCVGVVLRQPTAEQGVLTFKAKGL